MINPERKDKVIDNEMKKISKSKTKEALLEVEKIKNERLMNAFKRNKDKDTCNGD